MQNFSQISQQSSSNHVRKAHKWAKSFSQQENLQGSSLKELLKCLKLENPHLNFTLMREISLPPLTISILDLFNYKDLSAKYFFNLAKQRNVHTV